ncbi:MAG TPA: aldo/keto reductase [Candidatus Dormibacteraeota bacterium]|nr:aldo/keto reductase [Candidatus Dormibacteraeota bacterium]
MERRRLGRTGLRVPRLGFGCGAVGGLMVRGEAGERLRAVGRALEAGVRYFDTAPLYGDGRSEENLGRALARLDQGREALVGTKVRLSAADLEHPGAAVRRSLEGSLRRLGRERVELFQLHNPLGTAGPDRRPVAVDERLALGEVADAMRRAVEDGLAGHVGFTGLGETATLRRVLVSGRFETVQAYFNALDPSGVHPGATGGEQDFDGLIGQATAADVGVIAIRVYAAGALAATARRHPIAGEVDAALAGAGYEEDVDRALPLARLAAELGLEGGLELGLRFALAAPGVSVALVGLSSLEHLEAALRWESRGPLDPAAVDRVVALACGRA